MQSRNKNYLKKIVKTVLFPSLMIALTNSISNVASAAPTLDKLKRTARDVTVAIITCENKQEVKHLPCDSKSQGVESRLQGSGVIFARNKDTYYVLTAQHVVRSINDYQIVAPDNSVYLVKFEEIIPVPESDLAIVPFTKVDTKRAYKLAVLFTLCAAEKWQVIPQQHEQHKVLCQPLESLPDNFKQSSSPQVLVAGFVKSPLNSKPQLDSEPQLEFGILKDRNPKANFAQIALNRGYEYIYTSQTQDRMSGGPILDTEGQVVGIHGRIDGEGTLAYGYSLGIPIDTFLLWLTKTESSSRQVNLIRNSEIITSNLISSAQLSQVDIDKLLGRRNLKCSSMQSPKEIKEIMELSNRFYKLGRNQEALKCTEIALSIEPNFDHALFAKGFLLLLSKKYSDALEPFDSLTNLDPDAYLAWRWKGDVLYNLNRYEESAKAFEKAIEIYKKRNPNGEFYQAWYGKGLALARLGKIPESIAAQEIVKSFEKGLSGLIALGNGKFLLRDFEGARQAYQEALKLRKCDSEALIGLGRTLIQLGEYTAAIKELEQVKKQDQNSWRLSNCNLSLSEDVNPRALSQSWFELGSKYEQKNEPQKALDYYKKAIEIRPNNYQALFSKGVIEYKQDRDRRDTQGLYPQARRNLYREAFKSFEEAQTIRSDSQVLLNLNLDIEGLQKFCWNRKFGAQANHGWFIGNTKPDGTPSISESSMRDRNSVKRFKVSSGRSVRCKDNLLLKPNLEPIQPIEAENYLPKSAWDLVWKGLDEKFNHHYESALEAYDQAISIDPKFALAYYHRGILYDILDNKKRAREDFSQAILLNPNYADAYNQRGILQLALGDNQGAIEDFTEVIRIHPNYSIAYEKRGMAYFRFGNYQAAIEDYEQVSKLAIGCDVVNAHKAIGDIYKRKGDEKKAMENYGTARFYSRNQSQEESEQCRDLIDFFKNYQK